MRYPFVLFDVGGTLIAPARSFGAVYAAVLERHGLPFTVGAYDRAIFETAKEIEATIPPGADRYGWFDGGEKEYWLRFSRMAIERATGNPVEPSLAQHVLEELRGAFRRRESWHVYEDVKPVLRELREMGARLAVVSNWDSRLQALLETLELAEYFETCVVSAIEGVEKPDARIFEIALRSLGADAERTLHVGDRVDLDVEGARAAGIRGVLLDRGTGAAVEAGGIADLSALPRVARRGRRFA